MQLEVCFDTLNIKAESNSNIPTLADIQIFYNKNEPIKIFPHFVALCFLNLPLFFLFAHIMDVWTLDNHIVECKKIVLFSIYFVDINN